MLIGEPIRSCKFILKEKEPDFSILPMSVDMVSGVGCEARVNF